MLVFSRKAGEQMWISNSIELTVLGIHGSTVWLGFNAPPGADIDRAESITEPVRIPELQHETPALQPPSQEAAGID